MSQGPLCPNLTQKFQNEVSQIANRNFPLVMLLGGGPEATCVGVTFIPFF